MIRRKRDGGLEENRWTERTRMALAMAQEEAQRYGHDFIGSEHLLLGIADVPESVGAKALEAMGAGGDTIRSAFEAISRRGEGSHDGEIPLTRRAKRAIELGHQEARRLGHNYFGTEHLLVGLSWEWEGMAAGILESVGIDADGLRSNVAAILSSGQEPMPRKSNVVTCRVTGTDLDAIDALVEAGIRTTRSDAAAWLIHAGIQSNRELLGRVADTVAEIRRLREVAQALAGDGDQAASAP